MIDRVHRRDHSEKNLCRADVTRGFIPADVLLPRLQSEPIRCPAFSVVRHANKPAGHVSFVLIARGEVSRVRSTEPERHSKALSVTDRDVCAEFTRRFQQRQRQNVCGDDNERARIVRLPDDIGIIVNRTIGRGILDERAKDGAVESKTRVFADLDLDSERLRARLDDGNCLWVTIVGDEEGFPIWRDRMTKRHRFRSGRGFVQQRCVCDVERR